MPLWATILVVVAATLLVLAGVGFGGLLAWRTYTRRVLLRLVSRAEAIEAAGQALVETVTRLASAEDGALEEFVEDSESPERRALHEVATRAHMLSYELDRMPLPRSLTSVTEALADAAVVVDRQASRVSDPMRGDAALEALASMDLESVRAYMKSARDRLNDECVTHGLDDMAVYGGGLYL